MILRRGHGLLSLAMALLILAAAVFLVANVVGLIQDNSSTQFTQAEWNDWMGGVTQYNVDVKVTSSHAWQRHGDDQVTAALRCINENGTKFVISENDTRNLHLLCEDKDGNQFVVIIRKIKKSIDTFKNATSELVTAFKLEHGASLGSYIQNEVITFSKGIVVKLNFLPGEVFFMPYQKGDYHGTLG